MGVVSTIRNFLLGPSKEELFRANLFPATRWNRVEFAMYIELGNRPPAAERLWFEKQNPEKDGRLYYHFQSHYPEERTSIEIRFGSEQVNELCNKLHAIAGEEGFARNEMGMERLCSVLIFDKRHSRPVTLVFRGGISNFSNVVNRLHKVVYAALKDGSYFLSGV